MTKTMLIDAANREEVRVCVLENGRVDDFDFESSSRKPLRGNIYLARVTRVEPSLQAAFVEYGGNRHGFLAFNEIHPDYYQIPVSDRQAIQAAEAEEAALAAELGLNNAADEDDPQSGLSEDDHREASGDETEGRERKSRRKRRSRKRENRPNRENDHTSAQDAGEQPEAEAMPEESMAESGTTTDTASSQSEDSDAEGRNENSDSPEDDGAPKTVAFAAKTPPEISAAVSADEDEDEDEDAEEDDEEALTAQANEADENGIDNDAQYENDEEIETLDASADHAAPDGEEADDNDDEDDGDDEDETSRMSSDERHALMEKYREVKRRRIKLLRNYKIQEVIKRRQVILVQVVKEERGNKGAALTSYLSLAGRYCVLMPNTPRGGGISRKIPNASDRKRLRKVVDSLDVPQGMGLIIRTAGAKRTKAEIKRDYDYLTRLWENIRTLTLKSIAPSLIYEEASLIKRAIRDLYDKDIGEVLVEGETGYREAKDFMKMLMPSHAKNVQPYKERTPLFLQYDIEPQLDAMYQPVVRLKSGGYIVINQTEALIAIDVNSGKATRERNIEQTALRTNSEAAKEVARQCRMRDLAGLIVIDFIDMEEPRNNRQVEKRLKDALKFDRARIQVGRISSFGLLEMSRQRRRSGIVDGTTHACPTCNGAGAVRSHETATLRILRAMEAEALTGKVGKLTVKASLDVTLYILNHKRDWLHRIEEQYGVTVEVVADSEKAGDHYEIEKSGQPRETDASVVVRADLAEDIDDGVSESMETEEEDSPVAASSDESDDRPKRRRRRKRRRSSGGNEDVAASTSEDGEEAPGDAGSDETSEDAREASQGDASQEDDQGGRKRRRRGRRGGRRNGRRDETEIEGASETSGEQHDRDLSGGDADQSEPTTPELVAADESAPEERASGDAESLASDTSNKDMAAEANAPQKQTPAPPPDTPVDPNAKPKKGWWNRLGA